MQSIDIYKCKHFLKAWETGVSIFLNYKGRFWLDVILITNYPPPWISFFDGLRVSVRETGLA